MEDCFQKMSPLASKFLVLEPNENSDFQLENHQISRFAIWKCDFSDLRGPPKSNQSTSSTKFFVVGTVIAKLEFTLASLSLSPYKIGLTYVCILKPQYNPMHVSNLLIHMRDDDIIYHIPCFKPPITWYVTTMFHVSSPNYLIHDNSDHISVKTCGLPRINNIMRNLTLNPGDTAR